MLDAFDWDDGNIGKCQKHGVSIAEIEAIFRHDPVVAPDAVHSSAEERQIARYMRDKEVRRYESARI